MAEPCDLIIIGLGVGGIEVANQAAAGGLAVTAVEQNLVGGECPYWGCIPSKVMVRAADTLAEAARVEPTRRPCPGARRNGPRWPNGCARRPKAGAMHRLRAACVRVAST